MHRFMVAFLLLFLFFGCAKRQEVILYNSLDTNKTTGKDDFIRAVTIDSSHTVYRFRPFDRVAMVIYGQPEYSTPAQGVLIDKKGYANLPVVGKVKVAGLSESKATDKVQRLVRKDIVDAIVTVENPSKKVYIIGEINKPGSVKLDAGDITLLRAIGSAGGFRDTANKDTVYIVHKVKNKATLERVSLSGKNSLKNSFKKLVTGDIVYVAPTGVKLMEIGPVKTMQIIGQAMLPIATINNMSD